jgi:hypothetical protein
MNAIAWSRIALPGWAASGTSRGLNRHPREIPVATVPDRPAPIDEQPEDDVLQVLDEEIARLSPAPG